MAGPGLIETVRRNRIRIAVAAWAYENNRKPFMTDHEYDQLSLIVHKQRNIATGNHRMDRFYQRHFSPDTGLWIYKHPNKRYLENVHKRYCI